MKYTVVLAAFVAAAAAQDLSKIPACIQTCLIPALGSTGCQLTDFKCSCGKAAALQAAAKPCTDKCSAADQATGLTALGDVCASVGVPINSPPPPASSAAAPPPASSAAAPPPAGSSAAAKPTSATGYSSAAAPPPASTPCQSTSTVTVTVSPPKSTAAVPPYPTGAPKPSTPAGTAPGTPAQSSAVPPQYTGNAASSVEMPLAFAGVFGIAAMLL